MVLFNSYNDVIYNMGYPCYMEYIGTPTDLTFQVNTGSYTVLFNAKVEVLRVADGQVMEDITSHVTFIKYGNSTAITLQNFTDYMCSCNRFILKVSCETPLFEYYLGVYQISGCCPKGIDVDIDGEDIPANVPTKNGFKMGCRPFNLTIVSWNDCYDEFTGEWFEGGWKKVTNYEGRVIPKPKTIEKTLSRNCQLLHVESADVFEVEIHNFLTDWALRELEHHLHRQYLVINGETYIYSGNQETIAEHVDENLGVCTNTYLARFLVQKCAKRQYFMCGDVCSTSDTRYYYCIESGVEYWSEDRVYLGGADELEDYLSGLGYLVNEYGCVYSLTPNGAPPSLFANGTAMKNKIYPSQTPTDAIPILPPCATPEIGTITVSSPSCDTPVIGTVAVTQTSEDILCEPVDFCFNITDAGSGTPDLSYSFVELQFANINIVTKNNSFITTYTFDNTSGTITFDPGTVSIGDEICIYGTVNSFI